MRCRFKLYNLIFVAVQKRTLEAWRLDRWGKSRLNFLSVSSMVPDSYVGFECWLARVNRRLPDGVSA